MIIILEEEVADLELTEQSVVVIETYDFDLPSGITNSSFTQKGSILVGLGAGTFVELPPGADGEYLKYDSAETAGVKSEVPTITVNDQSNHLVNGGFDFAQGQTPGTLTTIADGGYGPDQWKSYRENADLQYRRVNASAEAGLTSPYYGEFKKITNAGKILVSQPLENMDTLKFRGQTVNFQLQMKASGAKTMKIAIVELQAAGTADTLPALVSAWGADGTNPTLGANLAVIGTPVSCSVTTAWQTFQFTGTFPATSKNLLVMVWSNADFAANDTVSLAEAGLYFGATQRSWTPRPRSQEIERCEYFYEKSYNVDTAPGTATSVGGYYGSSSAASPTAGYLGAGIKYKKKFKTPTLTLYDASGNAGKCDRSTLGAASTANSSIGALFTGESSALLYSTSGTSHTYISGQFVADSRL